MQTNPPRIDATAFDCPHCGAYTTQYWHDLYARSKDTDSPTPWIATEKRKLEILRDPDFPDDEKEGMEAYFDRMLTGLVQLDNIESKTAYLGVENLNLSKCFNCRKISVWVFDRLVFPKTETSISPNQDLPEEIIRDFEEARRIVNESPRGAAALLRLCVQKLCKHLGESGKNIDKDIGSLVSKGLNPLVQKALDVVRVIGNESVHPGELDLRDDKQTAIQLFGLINSICDQMISHPKSVQALYDMLPEGKREGIETRDKTK
ncbi:DUF4145 domain-containing protein [Pelagicoccus sp. SDUM812002]|nr:DUF4145 domain-containing protein [Pelagicoccus sp. SDUM812002]